jgi:hypothetical protein
MTDTAYEEEPIRQEPLLNGVDVRRSKLVAGTSLAAEDQRRTRE